MCFGIIINVDVNVKKFMCAKKIMFRNPAICNCENGQYLASIMDKIICDEIIEPQDEKANFNEKKLIC